MNPQARLGAFVLLAMVLLVFATGKVGNMIWFKQQSHIVETEFDDLLGLDIQAPVRMAGVKVGIVQDILLHNNKALVRIALNPGVHLPASTRASIVGRGLVGEKNLALTAKDGDTELLPDGALIPSDPAGDINTFISKSSGVTEDLQTLAHSLAEALGGENGRHSLLELISEANKAVTELATLIEENRQHIARAAKGFGDTGEDISKLTRDHRDDMDRLLVLLPETAANGRDFFKEGTATMRDMHEMLVENRENLYRIMFELRKASENLEAFSDDVRRNPWKVLSEKPEVKASPKATRKKMEEMILTTGHMGPIPANE
ncbi:MAG TPA: MlaD family protein [Mariprofundaceae bacterium]|nr:MlaD family protein [Mariprofundaceae bacterium]